MSDSVASVPRPHRAWGTAGVLLFLLHFFAEFLSEFPAMLRLRLVRRHQKCGASPSEPSDPSVVCVSDNLDEVNGIALASRIQLRELRRMGHQAYLFGTAFHARAPRSEGPDGSLVLAPGRFSTTTGWLNISDNFWATGRAVVSAPPPAA